MLFLIPEKTGVVSEGSPAVTDDRVLVILLGTSLIADKSHISLPTTLINRADGTFRIVNTLGELGKTAIIGLLSPQQLIGF